MENTNYTELGKKYWETPLKFKKPPILAYAGQVGGNPNWNFPSHKHDDLSEIIYICEGEGTFIINNKSYTAKEGDILIYNAGIIHEEYSNPTNPLVTFFCGISNTVIDQLKELCIIPYELEPIIRKNEYSNSIKSFFAQIFEESSLKADGYEIICQGLLTSSIALIHRVLRLQNITSETEESNSIAHRIKEFIDKNYKKNIKLEDIAEALFINKYYLSHVFKEQMKISPINYLINRRMGEAKNLLVSTELKIGEIARIMGYDNPNYFTLLFKKMTGETPKQFKENHKKNLFYHKNP
ncbi:AraC family transcriptional regulator [Neobacillus cucumis]|uniref:AraC family transcriptional regulator n=1 Tax=Neobacillus cucumis TaxID=1740721 RepID=UPI001964A2E8|nr:AraC family transcriptional regulator [Neobacillus cucumis]MBM7654702.1 AraC-like DNA-binding protein/mannose-6-phosphate isomerase-like protein (cupin superfamily) [Neobacillus cucumis]